jgi:antitoxin (DNA-binding transcriptional repressor) of toxin-antitoxin stability system
MAETKTVGVKELKNKLSAFLREVQRGTRILVADRGRAVAELHELGARYAVDEGANPILDGWVRSGIVSLPTRAREPLARTGMKLPDGTAARLLDPDRGDAERA